VKGNLLPGDQGLGRNRGWICLVAHPIPSQLNLPAIVTPAGTPLGDTQASPQRQGQLALHFTTNCWPIGPLLVVYGRRKRHGEVAVLPTSYPMDWASSWGV
jgi:hypothetical protein